MSHLGERVTALVDGQLPTEVAQRAARHLSDCPDCRQAVELERLMKYRLIGLGLPEPRTDLVSQLLTLGGPAGPLPPRNGYLPGSPRPQLIGIGLPPTRRDSVLRPMALPVVRISRASRNRVAAAVVGAACLVGAGVAGGVASGGVTAGGTVTRGPATTQRTGRATTFDTLMIGRGETVGWGLVVPRSGGPAPAAPARR